MRTPAQPIGPIRPCTPADIPEIHAIINDAAIAYKGVIPADRWHEPYMPLEELHREIAAGIRFCGFVDQGILAGVMGIQAVKDVVLIRHAYVRTSLRNHGIGGKLLNYLAGQTDQPVLIGTWAAADWAVRFYERHGFSLVPAPAKDVLLRTYWTVPDRQIATSVVLADKRGQERFAR